MRLTDGSTSPLHCRATYAVSGGGDHLDQSLDCASQRSSFTFHIEIDQTNGAILGTWQEMTRQVQGGVSGQGVPGKIEIAAARPGVLGRGDGRHARRRASRSRSAPAAAIRLGLDRCCAAAAEAS